MLRRSRIKYDLPRGVDAQTYIAGHRLAKYSFGRGDDGRVELRLRLCGESTSYRLYQVTLFACWHRAGNAEDPDLPREGCAVPLSTTKARRPLRIPSGEIAVDDMVIAAARSGDARGGCPLGSLGSQLAETDPEARALVAAGFGRWSAAIAVGLRALHAAGPLPAGIDPDDLAVTLLAVLQGGLLLAQVQRDTRPLETAVDTILALASASQSAGR